MSFLFPSSTITLDAALRDAQSPKAPVRLRAISALGDVEDATERRRAVEALTLALEDDHPAVRAEAAASLGGMGELAPIPPLVKRLGDGDAQVRQQAAIALGTLRDPSAFAPLCEVLRDGPADVRYQAVTSLAEIDAVASYEPLVAALADRDAQVVGAAAVALGSLGDGRAVQHLLPLLTRSEEDIRFEAAWALAELGDGRGRGELLAQLPGALTAPEPGAEPQGDGKRRRPELPSTAHPGRAMEAVEALAKLGRLAPAGSDEDRRSLARFLGSTSAPPEAIIVAARHVLELLDAAPAAAGTAKAERAAAERVLIAALDARKDPLRGLAVEQLLVVGGAWARPALEKLQQSRRGKLLAEPVAEALAAIASRSAGRAADGTAAKDSHVDR